MNKVVLITGSATGIGRATVLKFARSGWTVQATVKNIDEDTRSLQRIIDQEKLAAEISILDVTKQEDVDRAISEVTKKYASLDVLVNNAGFGFVGPVEDFTIEEVQEQYEVNLFGTLRINKAVIPHMRSYRCGHIINISSVNGLVSFPLYGIYSSSKFALETISEVQRFELAPFGIKVSVIEPGGFSTRFAANRRLPKQTLTDKSPYREWAPRFLSDIMEQGNKDGGLIGKLMNPERVADLIWRVANSKNPKLRYKIGIDTRLYTLTRAILPYSIWRFCMNSVFKWQ